MEVQMKTIVVVTTVILILAGGVFAQQAIKRLNFDKMGNWVSAYDKRRNGERLIISEVPIVEKVTYIKGYGLYTFTAEEGDSRETFYTSAPVARSLRQNLNSRAVMMTITCVLVEIASDQDTYRAPFATKIEGINMDSDTVWTITGPPPTKLKFR